MKPATNFSQPSPRKARSISKDTRKHSRTGTPIYLEPLESRALLTAVGPVIAGGLTLNHPSIIRDQSLQITANNVTDDSGTITQVLFYRSASGGTTVDLKNDQFLGRGTADGQGNWVLTTRTDLFPAATDPGAPATDEILAVAVDSNHTTSPPVATNVTVADHPPVITDLVSVPTVLAAGNSFKLKALGVTDPDATQFHDFVSGVNFYFDTNGDGVLDAGDTLLGPGTQAGKTWTFADDTTPPGFPTSGTATFFAQATDNSGSISQARTLTVDVVSPPTIAAVTAPANVVHGDPLTLTASGVAAVGDATIKKVRFYVETGNGADPNHAKSVGLGTETTDGTYQLTIGTNALTPGQTYTYFAVADDSAGKNSTPVASGTVVVSDRPPVVTALTVSPATIGPGQTLTLTAKVTDLENDATTVNFFFDTDQDGGPFDPATDFAVPGTVVKSGNKYTLTTTAPENFPISGVIQFFAQAVDSANNTSAVVSSIPQANAPPTIGSVTAGAATRTEPVTVTASNVADPDGTVTGVTFYLQAGTGPFDAHSAINIGKGTQLSATDWARTFTVPKKAVAGGQYTVYAIATDNSGLHSTAVASAPVTVANRAPTLTGLAALGHFIAAGSPVTLVPLGVGDLDGSVASVSYFFDKNDDGQIDAGDEALGTVNTPSNGFRLVDAIAPDDIPTSGPVQFLAQVTDDQGATSVVRSTTLVGSLRPTIASVSASATTVARGQPVTITAHDVEAPNDAVIKRVAFFFQVGDNLLPIGLANDTGTGDWTGTINTKLLPLMPDQILVRAVDSQGLFSDLGMISVTVTGTGA